MRSQRTLDVPTPSGPLQLPLSTDPRRHLHAFAAAYNPLPIISLWPAAPMRPLRPAQDASAGDTIPARAHDVNDGDALQDEQGSIPFMLQHNEFRRHDPGSVHKPGSELTTSSTGH